jgi:hypothetical protein
MSSIHAKPPCSLLASYVTSAGADAAGAATVVQQQTSSFGSSLTEDIKQAG